MKLVSQMSRPYQYEYMYMYEMYKTLFSSSLWYAVHGPKFQVWIKLWFCFVLFWYNYFSLFFLSIQASSGDYGDQKDCNAFK